ncbi:DUF3017 domain-containing protein [Yinghuangia sp. ASG 101]|uniref:DUF3017 domain-containing protein n=1 Tax=Yinghuangia sp. ASG 101 TaxID=2896848 RepID=UPI001E4D7009|nr:DUF3017 domain-containing protein [Yinghuangia sp. ASG 101]UGQ14529.1 DUF3017 domain-containing protein [Yinghuangia sp. ASG 101]
MGTPGTNGGPRATPQTPHNPPGTPAPPGPYGRPHATPGAPHNPTGTPPDTHSTTPSTPHTAHGHNGGHHSGGGRDARQGSGAHTGGGRDGRRPDGGPHDRHHPRPRIGHHPGHPAPIGRGTQAAPGRPGSRDTARAGRHPGTPADGTYVPEGGSSPTGVGGLREWPALVVLALLAASMVVAAVAGFRPATIMIGATFAVAAVLRTFVRDVGILAVRSRFTDVMVMLVFGASVVFLGLMVPPPLVDLPWIPNRTG